ncbi:glycosyltransferase [Adhaeribacter radiodurans]|uniref:Glycosyltransferase n=1 Tax=Adhaeribacter radiodurans TaxID=2745197 RepID=A0A7L7L6B2_9BACT|nr:glycosyltransferase [Adhaeribacter radiodurans]QMU28376.1 glycosyltransferase [Adhaeribacter radiodurans]
MKKTRILLSSVLKPINDTRMLEKLGSSLAQIPQTEIHIAGFPVKEPQTILPIQFHSFAYFKRLSWGRVKVQWQYWQLLRRLKPHLIIVSTHELLFITSLYKLLHGGKIWYDVRENYFLNLITQNAYPYIIKYLLAYAIRGFEYLSSSFINFYLLAEKSYAAELPFLKNKFILLENKFKQMAKPPYLPKRYPIKINTQQVKLLYSGTISEMHGIFETVELCRHLHQENAGFSLTIIGYCAIASTLQKLKSAIKDKPYITLIGGDKLVPHSEIIEYIQQSDLGLLPYQPHPSTFSCTPTKLFEYLANGLPVLVQQNPNWANRVDQYQAGINLDFRTVDYQQLLRQLQEQVFFPTGVPEDVFWETDECRLIKLYNKNF